MRWSGLKRQQMESIRKAEEAANAAGGGVPKKAEKWWDGPPTQTFLGMLDGVACQGGKARLNARGADGKAVVFVIGDPSKVVVLGGWADDGAVGVWAAEAGAARED